MQSNVVLVLTPEGGERRKELFARLDQKTLLIWASEVEIPSIQAEVISVNFKEQGIKKNYWALAPLALLAKIDRVISMNMLDVGLHKRFKGKILDAAVSVW